MRYFFHLRESGTYVADEEGLDLPSLKAARLAATASARCVIAGDAMAGKVPLRAMIEVDDETGARVLDLPFRDAVVIDG
ncbi:MAG TPA: hypothetical protein VF628_00240 [Allosphingosinicella sp.]|jgi:hypothetical protein